MATNNLKEHETEIANAIRTKKGTTAKINPQDFAKEILSISTGATVNIDSSDDTIVTDDVIRFFDENTDGTLIINLLEPREPYGSATVEFRDRNGQLIKDTYFTIYGGSAYDPYGQSAARGDEYRFIINKYNGKMSAMLYGREYVYSKNEEQTRAYFFETTDQPAYAQISWTGWSSNYVYIEYDIVKIS